MLVHSGASVAHSQHDVVSGVHLDVPLFIILLIELRVGRL